jgi:hypothetical protein
LSDDPIKGFDERIIKRARLPTVALLALPFLAILIRYFLYLVDHQFEIIAALGQLKQDVAAFAFLGGLPTVVLAFFRELQVHHGLDRIPGVRRRVNNHIADLMAELAKSSGYDHPERIVANQTEARHWFYFYVNTQSALRTYAFEVWEGYYVGLYLSLASLISFLLSLLLAVIFRDPIPILCAGVSMVIFVTVWGVRRWSTIPKLIETPEQQIAEIEPSGEVLSEARRRFG